MTTSVSQTGIRRLSGAPSAQGAPGRPHVLVVDAEPASRRSIARILTAKGFAVTTAEDGRAALDELGSSSPDVMLVDMMMPRVTGLEVLCETKARWPSIEVIMMTAFADVDAGVQAVKAGAYDFLTRPFTSTDVVVLSVEKAVEHRHLIERAARLEERLLARERFGELIGTSARMQAVYRLIEGVASATSTVLILGESGTGKALVARAIHQSSSRANKAFVPVNCAAIPKEQVEIELFGHARAGLVEAAAGGTIFLDEIGALPLSAQFKLLHVMQEGEVKRVGSDEVRAVDLRVVAAANVDLKSKIDSGEFRRDLYYRLNVIAIQLPLLRQRDDDVAILAHHFLQKLALRMGRAPKRVAPDAVAALKQHSWPGNVRELEQAVEHAFVLSQGDIIHAADLPFAHELEDESSPANELHELPYVEAKRRALLSFDEAYVREAMRRSAGNISEAARMAGLDRSNFRRIVRKFGPPASGSSPDSED